MRSFVTWPSPIPGGTTADETALVFDQNREFRLLILPAFFDEANKMRRQTVEIMHRLDLSGVDTFLPDLPGCNDSVQPLDQQTLADWQFAAEAAQLHFRATHCLAIRAGALLAPPDLPGWRYAPSGGRTQIRSMIRARRIASQEAGSPEKTGEIEELGRREGVELAGWHIGADMFAKLADAPAPDPDGLIDIAQGDIGGAGLWLRAEPDEDPEQADALAAIIAIGLLGQ